MRPLRPLRPLRLLHLLHLLHLLYIVHLSHLLRLYDVCSMRSTMHDMSHTRTGPDPCRRRRRYILRTLRTAMCRASCTRARRACAPCAARRHGRGHARADAQRAWVLSLSLSPSLHEHEPVLHEPVLHEHEPVLVQHAPVLRTSTGADTRNSDAVNSASRAE